jgi:carbamoyltransferase
MLILGISGSPNQVGANDGFLPSVIHDSSAAIFKDGKIIAAFEEERFTRIKHSREFPRNAINACLQAGRVSFSDIDYFAFAVSEDILNTELEKLETWSGSGRQFLQEIFHKYTRFTICQDKMKFYHHHFAHAAGAYYHSGFDNSLVATFDGEGDGVSGSIWEYSGGRFRLLRHIPIDQSLGHFYLNVTYFLGFRLFDEYKVMGLAPYGNPGRYRKQFEKIYELFSDGYFRFFEGWSAILPQLMPQREKGEEIRQEHKDLAAALQESLEQILFHVLTHFKKQTDQKYLSLAGGVALNGTFNGKLAYSGLFEKVFIHPAAGDNGLSVGTALACYHDYAENRTSHSPDNIYWGTDNRSVNLKKMLERWKDFVHFEPIENPAEYAAGLLAENKIIGWFQGQSEFGPRALGNRSVLADPRPKENKERVNAIIKMREGFRPFAPSIQDEHLEEYFILPRLKQRQYSYMTFVLKIKEKHRSALGAVTHVDGSARLQTVSKNQNPEYWQLIEHFRQYTGIPLVLNTSFNNNVEPIVDTPLDALVCYLTNALDHLIIANFLVTRKSVKTEIFLNLNIRLPAYIEPVSRNCGREYFLKDIYHDKYHKVSGEFYSLFNDKNSNIEDPDSLRDELYNLWQKRIITLSPE